MKQDKREFSKRMSLSVGQELGSCAKMKGVLLIVAQASHLKVTGGKTVCGDKFRGLAEDSGASSQIISFVLTK